MQASEWIYLAEGGKHAIFAYDGKEEWKGRVLRIAKVDLAHSCTAARSRTCKLLDEEDSLFYIRDVVGPLLVPYVDIPEKTHLEWEFVASLRDRTLSEGVIPASRRSGWARAKRKLEDIPSHAVAHLLWNYRQMRHLPLKRSYLCIEVKPKAGYTAFSPLVNPQNRVKYQSTRFEVLQQLHCNGYISKGWHTRSKDQPPELSLYDPLDLFSNDAYRVKRALCDLVTTPQNNMKVWMDDNPLLGADMNQIIDNLYESALDGLFCPEDRHCHSRASFFDTLASYMTHIFLQEELLAKLLRLQRLDVVDADGAILIYERLRELCGKDADGFLDSPSPLKQRNETGGNHILSWSPFQKPSDCPALDALIDEIDCFSTRLKSLSNCQLPSSDIMDQALERSKSTLKSLSRDACVYLLKNWLLSLAMCDVSFFLILCPVVSYDDARELGVIVDDVGKLADGSVSVRCQTQTSPGLLVVDSDGDRKLSGLLGKAAFVYTLKVIDYDMKPASKLRNRKAKEEPISFYKKDKLTEGI